MKPADIAFLQQKILVIYMFLLQFPDKTTNLHVLHDQYLKYCRDNVTIKYGYGKFFFAGYIQRLGCRRCRTTGPSYWKLPMEFNPEDLVELIQEETEKAIHGRRNEKIK